MYLIQQFIRQIIYQEPTGKRNILPPIITPKLPATSNFYVTAFDSCIMDNSKNISTEDTKVNPLPEKQGYFTRDKYEVGVFPSTDQFICKAPGILLTSYGIESSDLRF